MTASETLLRILAAPPADESDGRNPGRGERSPGQRNQPALPLDHPDRAAVDAIRRGEHGAFEQMFLSYHAALCDFAERLSLSGDDAADVVEEVFLAIWRGRRQFNVHTSIASYLYAAVRYRTVNVLRRQSTRLRLVTKWRSELDPQELDDGTNDEPSESPNRVAMLRAAIATLPERRRLALTLRWEAGMSNAEIAAVLSIAPQSVANLLQRALSDLRAILPTHLE